MLTVGDYQFDIYRHMRALLAVGNETVWEKYRPGTNVLWLHYLANKLLYAKDLPTPVTRLSARNQAKPKNKGHERSFSIILEGEDKDAYEGLLQIYNKINPKNPNLPRNAGEIFNIGTTNGWVV